METPLDAIPVGYCSLQEAFERLYKMIFESEVEFTMAAMSDERYLKVESAMLDAFKNGALEACYRMPGSEENKRILPDSWGKQFFVERIFCEPRIPHFAPGNPFHGLSERTPFVSIEKFSNWSIGYCYQPIKTSDTLADPMDQSTWNIGTCISWIVWRQIEIVKEYQRLYFEHLGLISAVEMVEEEHSDLRFTSPEKAFAEIQEQCYRENLIATGVKISTDHPVEIPAREWPHLQLITSRQQQNFWQYTEDTLNTDASTPCYRDVRFNRDDVMGIWLSSETPPQNLAKSKLPKPSDEELTEFFISEYKNPWLKSEGVRITRAAWVSAAREKFPGATIEQARIVFRESKPPAWTAGRSANQKNYKEE